MAVRKIEYTVTADGISPSTIQKGGVQGEHNATEVVFNLEISLYNELQRLKNQGNRIVYRIDKYNGEGSLDMSDTTELSSQSVNYLVEEKVTRFGGLIKIVLVITAISNDSTEAELYTLTAKLQLQNLPNGRTKNGEDYKSMSTLAEVVKKNAKIAEDSKSAAVESMELTVAAKAALQNGTDWIFDGGDARKKTSINFVVDMEMNNSSNNAIANRVVKKYIDNLFDLIHPIGSLYFSSSSTEPSQIFGGTWERIKDRFILAAGEKFPAGSKGGAATHTLTIDELPSHNHAMHFAQATGSYFTIPYGGSATDWGNDTNTMQNTGGNLPHNNMPPYEAYYCWKRIA